MLKPYKVENISQAQIVRLIRNSGREWMTHYTNEITEDQQTQWWKQNWNNPRIQLYLFANFHDNGSIETVGFGMIKLDDSDWYWATLAVVPECRGQGYGTQIYQWLIELCPDDLWIEIQRGNEASLQAAIKAGFQVYGNSDHLHVLVARKGGKV